VFFGKTSRVGSVVKVLNLIVGVALSSQGGVAQADRGSWETNRRQPAPSNPLTWESPDCLGDDRTPLNVDNGQVLQWKVNTPNQFKARANVLGEVVRVFEDRPSHNHFEIKIGPKSSDVLEVIYNKSFGTLREPQEGMKVQACGDYITSFARAGQYPASPSGAIIHWVHFNPREEGHPHGYLIIEGELFGDDVEMARRRDSRRSGRQNFKFDWTQPLTSQAASLLFQ
jgi:hypothetical protein